MLALLLMLPVSVGISSWAITPFDDVSGSTLETFLHVPTLMLVAPTFLWAAGALVKGKARITFGYRHLLALTILFSIAAMWGLTRGGEPLLLAYFAQTVLPFSGFILGSQCELPPRRVARWIAYGWVLTTALGVVASRAADATAVIPQFRNQLPVVLMIGTVMTLSFWTQMRGVALLGLGLMAALAPSLWSRAGLVSLAAALGVLSWYYVKSAHPTLKAIRVGLVVGMAAVLATAGAEAISGGVVGERTRTVSLSSAGSARGELASEGLRRLAERPIFGDSFRSVGIQRAGGNRAAFPILFPSHNQFIDYGIRGGVLAPLLLLGLLKGWLRRATMVALRTGDTARFGRASAALLLGAALGCLFHLHFVHGTTATILFFIAGYTCRLAAEDNLGDATAR